MYSWYGLWVQESESWCEKNSQEFVLVATISKEQRIRKCVLQISDWFSSYYHVTPSRITSINKTFQYSILLNLVNSKTTNLIFWVHIIKFNLHLLVAIKHGKGDNKFVITVGVLVINKKRYIYRLHISKG
jgi:hypothetical protein